LLWFELRQAFNKAYSGRRNESLIARIYEFAHWCEEQPRGATAETDLATCVSVSFFEHIIELSEARDDMPRWFSLEEFNKMESVFRYHLSDKDFDQLKKSFAPDKKKPK
jgi:hypothetical protein